jgi:hypothetical protein
VNEETKVTPSGLTLSENKSSSWVTSAVENVWVALEESPTPNLVSCTHL